MWLPLILLLVATTPAPCETGERACDPQIVILFGEARAHDVQAIIRQGPVIASAISRGSPDRELQQSYELALYVADPRRFTQRYVRAFSGAPAINFLFARLAQRGLVPDPDRPFAVILRQAQLRNPWAMRAVLISTVTARNDFIPDGFDREARAIELDAQAILPALRAMTPSERFSVLCTSAGMDREPYDRYVRGLLKAVRPQTRADRIMLRELIALKSCAAYDANF